MLTDKEMKKQFKKIAEKDFEKYYPVQTLRELGFARKQCTNCQRFFWSVHSDQTVCGDSQCSGGFRFIGNSPTKHQLDYIDVWKKFSKTFQEQGYTPIKRYPVVARWNPTTDFTIASIAAFQPSVVSGEIEPPANPLVIPQFCLRFGDVDNVGITGHNVGFVMMGQHQFVEPKKYNRNEYLKQIYMWLDKGLGLPKEEITFHEDAWAGGGNFGSCMEFFSRGLEVGNQVYMEYEQTETSYKELNIKVLDMGEGQERAAWFSQGTSTNYEATFPTVCKKLFDITGIKQDKELMKKFLPYSSYLNIDEVEDINKAWAFVAEKLQMQTEELREKVSSLAGLFSVAEHSRAALVAIADGQLPSNMGGGYNLRIILRRALSFIDKYNWDVTLQDVCKWHAAYLKSQYPELSEQLTEVDEILAVEKKKYLETKKRAAAIVANILKKEEVTDEKLVELYDSSGISPETVKEEARKIGKIIKIPEDFYMKLAERHEKASQKIQIKKEETLSLEKISSTEALYFGDYTFTEFDAKIIKIIGDNILLDRTAFYPTSGGQMHDLGKINNFSVINVFKQGNHIIHVVPNHSFKEGETVHGSIDKERRRQLAQHHTTTHILNGCAKKVLGNHIWQAGASKDIDKARIDITHYESLTDEQIKKIEDSANEIVAENLVVKKFFMQKSEAEKKYGFVLYQGGVAPGKTLRIVEVAGLDVEACGGTHLNFTGEAGHIKILRLSKIQDGIVRLEFVSGKAAEQDEKQAIGVLQELMTLLSCKENQIPGRSEELFTKWKDSVKKGKEVSLTFTSTQVFKGDILQKTAEILKTQPEHLIKTIERFIKEIKEKQK